MKFLIFIFIICPLLLKAEYNKLQWSDCGSKELVINDIDFRPMPAIHPGRSFLDLKINLKRDIVGKLKTSFNIVRKVSGVNLPIRCYIANGVYVGSCSYDDTCQDIKALLPFFKPETCPQFLAVFGIDCYCPLNVKAGNFEILNQEIGKIMIFV